MANLTLASAVLNAARTALTVTIGSTTTVTTPLALTTGVNVTGFTLTADGVAVTLGTTIPVPGGASKILTVPVTGTINPGQVLVLTATSSNLEDSAGTPLVLTNQYITATFVQSALQTSLAALFTADPLITILQTAADFGKVYNVGGGQFVVYDLTNLNLLATFQCTLAPNGTLTRLTGYQLYTGSSYALPNGAFTVTNANVASLFTNDPAIAYLQAGTFGPIAVQPGGRYKVLALDGVTPLFEVFARTDSTGAFTELISWTAVRDRGPASSSSPSVTPGLKSVTNSTGALSNVQLTTTSYVSTKYASVTAALTNAGLVYINSTSSYWTGGFRLNPGQTINLPVGANLNTFYANFVSANDLVNFSSL